MTCGRARIKHVGCGANKNGRNISSHVAKLKNDI
jgi:hypothetical protein